MSKITKMAIERAESIMCESILHKMKEWDKKNPSKTKPISAKELAAIAIKDPAWLKKVVDRAVDRYNTSMGTCPDQLASDSPMVASAVNAALRRLYWKKKTRSLPRRLWA